MALSRTRLLMMGIGDPALAHHLCCRTRVLSSRMSVGDPGFLSALKSIGGAALSFVPGGGVVKHGLSIAGSILSRPKTPVLARGGAPMVMAPQPSVVNRILNRALPNITPTQARAGGFGVAGAALGALGIGQIFGGGAVPPAVAAAAGMRRRRRRMRVTNIKALGRSTRRLAGFHKLSQHVEQQLSHLVRRRTRTRRAFGKRK